MLSFTVSLPVRQFITVLLTHVLTERVVTNCHLDAVTMPLDTSTRSIPDQPMVPFQESMNLNQITNEGNYNVLIRTNIKAIHRVDALTGRISSAAKVHVSLTYPWSQQNDEYHRCHIWENTESSNLASEVRWRKSRPATTGGIWSLLSHIQPSGGGELLKRIWSLLSHVLPSGCGELLKSIIFIMLRKSDGTRGTVECKGSDGIVFLKCFADFYSFCLNFSLA
jgi:hypothetical protein